VGAAGFRAQRALWSRAGVQRFWHRASPREWSAALTAGRPWCLRHPSRVRP